jgi:hypothetical protein
MTTGAGPTFFPFGNVDGWRNIEDILKLKLALKSKV